MALFFFPRFLSDDGTRADPIYILKYAEQSNDRIENNMNLLVAELRAKGLNYVR